MIHNPVQHARTPDPDESNDEPHPGRHVAAVTLPRVHFLERPLPDWWNGFEDMLTERKRITAKDAAMHPRRGTRMGKRKGAEKVIPLLLVVANKHLAEFEPEREQSDYHCAAPAKDSPNHCEHTKTLPKSSVASTLCTVNPKGLADRPQDLFPFSRQRFRDTFDR